MAQVFILGGGVAGLSAGIYAQMSGHQATVCEKNAVPGGNLTGWNRGGCHIDNCIHWLTGTNAATGLYKTWEELGVLGGVDVIENESLYTFEKGGGSLSLCRDLDRLEQRMIAISPRDEDEILRFTDAIRTVQYISGIGGRSRSEGLGAVRTALYAPTLARYVAMTTGDLAARFSHPLLSGFITALLTEDFGALALIIVFAHFTAGNADLVRGGSLAAAKRMAKRFTDLGGELILGAGVVRVNAVDGVARSAILEDGRVYGADHFIITADPAAVFDHVLPVPMPRALAARYRRRDLLRFSCFQCAFACPTDLLPFHGELVFELPANIARALGQKRMAVREFSHEPTFAPPGETLLQTMIFCDENAGRQFIALAEKPKEYAAVKRRLAAKVEEAVTERFPRLRGALRSVDCWTPATYRRYVGTECGSFMSFAFGAGVLPRTLGPKVDGLDNVFLATQWQSIPGGLPLAAECGKRAAQAVDRAEKRARVRYGGGYRRTAPAAP